MTDPPKKKRCDKFPAIHGAPVTVISYSAPLSAPVRHVLTISWRTASLVSIKQNELLGISLYFHRFVNEFHAFRER
jgi:hypothetical protein